MQITNEQRAAFVALTETLVRQRVAALHGIGYNNERDFYKVGGYKEKPGFADFEALYTRDPVAAQIVDMVAEATWRSPPEISEPDQPEGTKFTEAFEDLQQRLGLWNMFERVDRLARIGRYAVLLIGTRGGDDSSLETPLTSLTDPQDVLYLSVYNERYATVRDWVVDGRDPRFGMPFIYNIDMSSGIATFRPSTMPGMLPVHWSRVIHVAEGLLNDEVHGRPALERIYNDLYDFQKVSTSTAEAFWQRVAGILGAKLPTGPNVSPPTDEELAALDEGLKELFHDLRRTFFSNAELYRLAETEPNPEAAANLYMTRISAGAAIPKRMLFGSETGERASSEDQKTYLGSISERQKQHAEPRILRPFLNRLIELRAFERPANGYEVVWPTLFQVPEKEVAEANRLRAEAIAKLVPVGGDPTLIYEIGEDRNIWPIPRKAEDPSPFEDVMREAAEDDEPDADTGRTMPEAA